MDACGLYKTTGRRTEGRGERRDRAMMGGAVFVACRNNGAPRSHEEIAKMFLGEYSVAV
jgi:transcription initiation factor TFIIIB Brf1 subunit/transcription initiation factor TFIIB